MVLNQGSVGIGASLAIYLFAPFSGQFVYQTV